MTDALRLRARMIGVGLWLSAVLIVAVSGWVAATWDRPHRAALAALVATAGVTTLIIARVPRERVVQSRLREPLFMTWSVSLIAFIAIAAALDSGVRSPLVLLLFLTQIYAALSYPRLAVAVLSGVSLLVVMVLSLLGERRTGGPTDPFYLAGLMLTLGCSGVMCVLQARIQGQARDELQRLSRSDSLTGCLNRLGFAERLTQELAHGEPLALIVLDFDGFKAVNDEHGHAAGDELLIWAVQTMTEVLRPSDMLGRLGGDEFAVGLPGVAAKQACVVADRLRLALSSRITASAGVASSEVDGPQHELLHQCADERLYRAKRAGRNCVVVV